MFEPSPGLCTAAPVRTKIRWWDEGDLPALKALFTTCLPEEGWQPDDFCRFSHKKQSAAQNVLKLLVERDTNERNILGAILYTLTRHECRVRRLCVWPEQRRLGYGRRLVTSLCGPQSPIRREQFSARVNERYWEAAALFVSLGWSFDPAEPRHRYANGDEAYWFRFYHPRQPLRVRIAE